MMVLHIEMVSGKSFNLEAEDIKTSEKFGRKYLMDDSGSIDGKPAITLLNMDMIESIVIADIDDK